MSDVAARAGVSLKSVSRVVNAERYVSRDLSDRVHRAITELGYRPDRRARDLATPHTGRLIGFVQVDAANPFFAAVYRGLEDATRDGGALIIAGSTDADPDREATLIETLIEFRVDGLVVAAAEGSDDLLRHEIDHGTSVVLVDRLLPNASCDTVVSTNRDSTRAAVGHLLQMGHTRIAFIGGDQRVWTASERLAGYHDALDASGAPRMPDLEIVGVDDPPRAAQATRRLLELAQPPTALFTAQDRITTGALTALHDLGRQHDVALFGFDEIPFAAQLSPSVSLVEQDPYEMGRRAGELLLRRLGNGTTPEPIKSIVEAPLRHRLSGNLAPSP